MRVFVLGTGSSVNALLVGSNGTRVLVDAGVGPRKTEARLARLGVPFSERAGDRIDAVIATQRGTPRSPRSCRSDRRPRARVPASTCRLTSPAARSASARSCSKRSTSPTTPRRSRCASPKTTAAPPSASRPTRPHHERPRRPPRRLRRGARRSEPPSRDARVRPYPDRLKRRASGGLGHLSNDRTAELAQRLSGTRLTRPTIPDGLALVAPRG